MSAFPRAATGFNGASSLPASMSTQWLTLEAAHPVYGIKLIKWRPRLCRRGLPGLSQLQSKAWTLVWTWVRWRCRLVVNVGHSFRPGPALDLLRCNLDPALKEEGTPVGMRISRSWFRNALVVGQIAISLSFTIGAGFLVRSVQVAPTREFAFATRNVLVYQPGWRALARFMDAARVYSAGTSPAPCAQLLCLCSFETGRDAPAASARSRTRKPPSARVAPARA